MRCVRCGIKYGPGEVPIICVECRPGHPIDPPSGGAPADFRRRVV